MYEPFEIGVYVVAGLLVLSLIFYAIPKAVADYRSTCPSQKTLDRLEGIRLAKKEWRLRCDLIKKSERKYLSDYSEFKKDLIEWKKYQTKRLYYAQEVIKLAENKVRSASDFTDFRHEKRNKILEKYNKYIYNEENEITDTETGSDIIINDMKLIWLLDDMRDRNVSFVYRPGIDYMAINGPDWADFPDEKYMEAGNRFTIKVENMGDVVMDRKKYYREDTLRELMKIRYKK